METSVLFFYNIFLDGISNHNTTKCCTADRRLANFSKRMHFALKLGEKLPNWTVEDYV